MMVMRISLVLVLFSFACGGSDDDTGDTTVSDAEETSGHESTTEPDDGVAIEGLMGTISSMAVERAMEPRMQRFLQCFSERYTHVDVLGGRIELSFRIKVDGTVLWVYPSVSTVGDRETERCILDVAERIRFSRPRGGEAEFAYPFTLDLPEQVRPPLNWDESRVASSIETNRGEIADCGRGPYSVTVYIRRGGDIMAVGAATSAPDSADDLDCVTRVVSAWDMPDPGSYPAKVTFTL